MSLPTTTREGSVNVLGSIASFLHGYSGEITIVRELVQNADDAPGNADTERWIEFDLRPDALVVRNNSVFSAQDFQNIADIAHQGKRLARRRTIGRFGIGFVSVYQLTDTPIIRSSGHQWILRPSPRGFPIEQTACDVIAYTEFELPYRTEPTLVGELLDMALISPAQLATMRRDLPDEAARLLFFLRHLSRIRVCEAGQLVREVWRDVLPPSNPGGPEQVLIHGREADGRSWTQRWLRFTGKVSHTPAAHATRDETVQIVIPDRNTEALSEAEAISGRLYNYLPTEILTGLPFHLNGDFIPTTDRKGIDNDHRDREVWNRLVIEGLGACFAAALPALLDQFKDDPAGLYRRLPLTHAHPLVSPVVEAFFGAARNHAIFKTRIGWRKPNNTFRVSAALRPLLDGIALPVMEAQLEAAAQTLLERLDVPAFTLQDLVKRWKADLGPGTLLTNGPDYLNTPEQIQQVYATLERHFAQTEPALLGEAPIFLDHQGKLWPANRCVRCTLAEVQTALADSGLHFWEPGPHLYLARLVPELTLDHVVEVLRAAVPKEVSLKEAPLWLNSTRKLFPVYRALDALRRPDESLRGRFERVAICIDRAEWLRLPRQLRMPGDAPVLYEILAADPEPVLVLKSVNEERKLRQLYADMGVTALDAGWLVEYLERRAGQQSCALDQTHASLNTSDKLKRIYRFLCDRLESLGNAELQTLRHRTAIWLCQDEVVRLAREVYAPPTAEEGWPKEIVVDGLLSINSQDRLGPLLERLAIKALDHGRFITDKLIPQVPKLDKQGYMNALRYLKTQLPLLHSQPDVLARLREAAIIYAEDRQLAKAADLCYPTKDADEIFGAHMRVPQIKRYFGEGVPAEQTKWHWHALFELLGCKPVPPGPVVLSLVKAIQAMPVHEARVHSERLFRYLERHWETFYGSAGITAELRRQPWLPAYNDDSQLYKPSDLFPRIEQALVAHVKKTLGFRDVRRPQAAIANALGMPSVRESDDGELRYAHLVIEELLLVCKLCDPEHPPELEIYRFLDQYRPKGLGQLWGKPVIYEKESKRYWKPEQIFLENHKAAFGTYRGYALNHPFAELLAKLGARSSPQISDYRNVVQEIAEQMTGPVPPAEQTILRRAYTALADAKPDALDPLRRCACILTQPAGELSSSTGDFLLKRPEAAVLQPPSRIQRVLPLLPVARYDPEGERALRELGVRSLDALLEVQLMLGETNRRATTISGDFVGLGAAIRRLLYQTTTEQVEKREAQLWAQIKAIQSVELPTITVTYTVRLGADQIYTSDPQHEAVHYSAREQRIYLRAGVSREERIGGLAEMLGQLLDDQPHLFSLLRDLLRDPGGADETLDRNNYRQLPASLTTAPIDATVGDFWIGATGQESPGPEPEPMPILPISPPVPPVGPRPGGNGGTAGGSKPSGGTTASKGPKGGPIQPPPPNPPPTPPAVSAPRPAFTGIQELRSPTVPTDVEGLLDRAQRWGEQQPPPDAPPPVASGALPRARKGINPDALQRVDVASFTLSFPEVNFGFLRLHKRAQALFRDQPDHVRCETDAGQVFILWLDWSRKPPIAYAQSELGQFFADEEIPAGGIVYLERRHSDYRLYFNEVPHMVREVRIAWNEQGRVTYETLDAVAVNCETVDAVYRAEKRFEDKTALWLEAASKKSVLETLCDLFMSSEQVWIHEDDLTALVMAERMVSAPTVRQTLQDKECFDEDGSKRWCFVPQQLERALQRDPSASWLRATMSLLRADPAMLAQNLASLRQALGQVTERLRELESPPTSGISGDVAQLVGQMLAEPENDWPFEELERLLQQQIEGSWLLNDDPQIGETLQVIAESELLDRFRATLFAVLDRLRGQQKFERVDALCRLWFQFDPGVANALNKYLLEAKEWATIKRSGAAADTIAQALARVPNIPGGLAVLQRALYRDLAALAESRWLDSGGGVASVDTFYADIASFAQGRGLLSPKDRKAFDEAVLQRVREIWGDFNEIGRMGLAVLLPQHAPEAGLLEYQLDFLQMIAKQRRSSAPLETMLVSKWAFNHTNTMNPMQHRDFAELLAASHRHFTIWELTQKQPWLQRLDELQRREINSETIVNERNRRQRMAHFLDGLKQFASSNAIAPWFEPEILELQKLAEAYLG